jgi:hypothetical protein
MASVRKRIWTTGKNDYEPKKSEWNIKSTPVLSLKTKSWIARLEWLKMIFSNQLTELLFSCLALRKHLDRVT